MAEVLQAAARDEARPHAYYRDDLPPRTSFKTYSSFRRAVQEEPGAVVRPEVPPPRSAPAAGAVHEEPGAGRLFDDLGFSDLVFPPRDDRAPVEFVGGERVALAWVNTYVSKFLERYYVGATNTMRKGKSDRSRRHHEILAMAGARMRLGAADLPLVEKLSGSGASDATGWLKHELVWRDYPASRPAEVGRLDLQARRHRRRAAGHRVGARRRGGVGAARAVDRRAHGLPVRRRLHAGARGDGVHDALRARVRVLVFSARPRRRLAARRRLL